MPGQGQGQNGYRRLVLITLLFVSLAVILWAVLLSVVLDHPFVTTDWILLAFPAGLAGYVLRLLFGSSPWEDILIVLCRLLNANGNRNRNGNGNRNGRERGNRE